MWSWEAMPSIIQFKYNYSNEEYKSICVNGRGKSTKFPDNL